MTLAVLGLGTMGQAIVRGLVAAGDVPPESIHVYDHGPAKRAVAQELGVTWHATAAEAARAARYVIVATKPKDYAGSIGEVAAQLDGSRVLVSIAGGLDIAQLHAMAPDGTPVVRVMPNTPIAYRAGMSIVARDDRAGDEQVADVVALFSQLGQVVEMAEKGMSAATALAGCGPAFVYQVIEGLADGAVAMGLPRGTAYQLAAQMVRGAATTVAESGEHPGKLKDDVTTPGGSTIRGVLALEDAGVRAAFSRAVIAASQADGGAR